MRVSGKNMAVGIAAAIPAVVAGAFAWNRIKDKEDELYLEDFGPADDPRVMYDGTE